MSNFKIDNSTIVNQLEFSYNGKLEDISKSTTGNFLLKPSLYKTLIHSIGVTEILLLSTSKMKPCSMELLASQAVRFSISVHQEKFGFYLMILL